MQDEIKLDWSFRLSLLTDLVRVSRTHEWQWARADDSMQFGVGITIVNFFSGSTCLESQSLQARVQAVPSIG